MATERSIEARALPYRLIANTVQQRFTPPLAEWTVSEIPPGFRAALPPLHGGIEGGRWNVNRLSIALRSEQESGISVSVPPLPFTTPPHSPRERGEVKRGVAACL